MAGPVVVKHFAQIALAIGAAAGGTFGDVDALVRRLRPDDLADRDLQKRLPDHFHANGAHRRLFQALDLKRPGANGIIPTPIRNADMETRAGGRFVPTAFVMVNGRGAREFPHFEGDYGVNRHQPAMLGG